MKKFFVVFAICCLVAFDQWSKQFAMIHLIPYESYPLITGIQWTLAFNTGAAFSFLNGFGQWHQWFFPLFSFIMSIFLSIWLWRTPSELKYQQISLFLILTGAIGNFIDRAYNGFVIDFIDIYYHHYHWPIFNVADIYISMGAIIFFIQLLFLKERVSAH